MQLICLWRVCEWRKFRSVSEVLLGHVLSSCKEVRVAFKSHLKIMEFSASRRCSTSSRPPWPSCLRGFASCILFSSYISVPSFPFWPRSVHVRKEKKEAEPSDSFAESSHHSSLTANPGWGSCLFAGFPRRKMAVLKIQEQVRLLIYLYDIRGLRNVVLISETNKSWCVMVLIPRSHLRSTSTPLTNLDA